jgi:hypothetical protein
MKKNTYLSLLYLKMTNEPYKKTLMPLKAKVKFFKWRGKNAIILF